MITETMKLWENRTEKNDLPNPTLAAYVLDGKKKRGAVLICPGGGYGSTSDREAEPIAMQFTAAGFHAFVVYYSVAPAKHPQPLLDVSRAICIIRERAEEWQVDVDKIAVCGFSAGGHLAASLGVHWEKPYIQQAKGINKGMNKPNALILAYPVITSGKFAHRGSFDNLLGADADKALLNEMSLELQVTKQTPPTYIWHTYDDNVVPLENTLLFAQALRAQDVPFELHIFPKGPHGLSLATEETDMENKMVYPTVAVWTDLCIAWLKNLFI